MIDLNDLQVFAKVVEAGGFAAAGRSLGLPVSSVSRKVARLERRLGVPLLRRTTRSLGLTEAGLLYHRHCERALAELGAAEAAMGGWHAAPRGTLRVSAPIAFGRFVLAPLLGAFAARHPEVQPVVVLTNRYVDLAEEGFDLAIRTGALPDSGLRARRLGESALLVAASAACLARWGVPRARRDFERLPCLVLGEDTATARWVFVEAGRRVSVRVRPAVVSNDMDLLHHAALAGVGFAMLPGFLLAPDLASDGLRAVEGDWTLQRGEVHAVHVGPASPGVRALTHFLRERLAGLPHWSNERSAAPALRADGPTASQLPEV